VHGVALTHQVVDHCVDGTDSTVSHQHIRVGVQRAVVEVGGPPLTDLTPKKNVSSGGRVLVVVVVVDDRCHVVEQELRWCQAGNTVAQVDVAILESKLVELGPNCEQIAGLRRGKYFLGCHVN